jgi:trk system potassium uptake protein TrkA
MRRFVVIGLGKFGSEVARTLFARGHEVVGIDSDPQRVQDLRDHCTRPVTTDSTEQENLRALDLAGADAAVVSLGERMDASILVTLYLKELGLRKIVVKAVSEDHGKILSLIGATAVVLPERDTAQRLARALGARSIVEYLPLGVGFGLEELAAPQSFWNRDLRDLAIRKRHEVLVVAVKNKDRLDLVPGADYVVREGDILVVVGKDAGLAAITHEADEG